MHAAMVILRGRLDIRWSIWHLKSMKVVFLQKNIKHEC